MDKSIFYLKRKLIKPYNYLRCLGKPKVFGIGFNKTGTTSLTAAMRELGYVIGNQRTAEMMEDDWAVRNFSKLFKYCRTAQFFQDFPFSFHYTFIALDQKFKDSKFILTMRDSPEQWYNSVVNFHSRIYGKNGRIPTKEDLQNATYIYTGRPWKMRILKGMPDEEDLYNKEMLIDSYNRHNRMVKEYFMHRPDDLLVLNVAEAGAFRKLSKFLGIEHPVTEFPWKNRTETIGVK